MRTLTLILATCFLSLCFPSNAQVKTDLTNTQQDSKPPVIKKGYYSIGNNAEKLSRTSSWVTTGESYPAIQKGFYAIGNNHKKLGKQLVIERNSESAMPVIKKGYYSIGENRGKLK